MTFHVLFISTLYIFSYRSVLALYRPMPEIPRQIDYHLARHDNGVSMIPHTGKIGYPVKVILPVTKYKIITVNVINSIFIQGCHVTSLQLIQEPNLPA